jgi:hypothetical protein
MNWQAAALKLPVVVGESNRRRVVRDIFEDAMYVAGENESSNHFSESSTHQIHIRINMCQRYEHLPAGQ